MQYAASGLCRGWEAMRLQLGNSLCYEISPSTAVAPDGLVVSMLAPVPLKQTALCGPCPRIRRDAS